ncbi:girdin isoform X3 [Salmo salar]|uniref:Girdin isoform X3 n=1 Tax=Salmo salar TaxID=8030 RepID=A0A1S3S9M0_SALSA|nr:girdin isoform X3 [Salmo salar]|eukprot:XP_014061040.1 PREDICTED: girdin-like isoform X3 [Salmo salar]
MESEVFTPLLEQFLLTPLVAWVKAAGHSSGNDGTKLSEYIELLDGIYLNEIMLEINPKATVQRTNKKVNNDSTLRIHNLSILIRQIKSYYQETLQQLVAMPLPNVLVLGRNPLSEQGLEEMRKLLLLLLGCAVQCEKKEEYIERIQTLDFDTKAAIASHIQEVTHNQENVVDLQWLEGGDLPPEDLDSFSRNMAFHLKRLVDERDDQLETIVELTQERDCGQYSPPPLFAQSPNDSPSMRRTESRQHLSVELADAKAKIRRLRQELEEKSEQLLDCRQELDNMETENKRIQQESMQLLSDARSARAYRDELDVLREKAIRVDKLESEVGRYKERLHDIEFYKARVEELKEDNQVLLETKAMLKDQLEGTRARSDKLHELEKESLQLKSKIHDMEMERDMDRKRIEELLEENLVLEMAQKQSMDESLHLGWELEQLSKTPDLTEVPQKSLGHEVNELTSSRLLKLEKENQALLKTVEELRGSASEDAPAHYLKANKENQRLTQRLVQLESELNTGRESLCSAESLSTDLMKEKALLEKTLETLRENADRQVKGLEQENEHLTQTVSSLRQRSQVGAEARVKDVEKENRVLHESIRETSSKLNKLEFERKQLRKDLEMYKEKGERAEELEVEAQRLERENEALQKRVASLGITCDKVVSLEKENSELEAEGRRLKKMVDGLRSTSFQLEALEKENSQLDEENLELRRTVEVLRSAGNKAAQLELENLELESERSQLRRSLELLKASSKKTERLEVSNQGLDTENQRLQKALDNSSRKMQQLEGELQDIEQENQSLQRSLEELKISSKRLEQLEQENKTLEQESSQLEKDKKHLEKDNKRLRQQAEIRDSKMDEDNLRISHLEKDNRLLGKEMTSFKDSCNRLKDLEKENKELVKQATIDKKTLVTLREELVSEKLRTQQMNNDLEKLTHELEKMGLNKERLLNKQRLLQDEQSSDDDRYKLLEFKLESTLKSTLEIKEEKIAALEARLQESSNLNQQLRQELKTVKKNYEALRQREEEERMVQSSPPRRGDREDSQAVNRWEKESHETTRELLKVKDRLIEVERNNATLQAEKQALHTNLKQLETQSNNLQAQILALQRQTASLQENNTTLQTQNAKLQVENSTLNSQSGTLMAQNAQLATQQSSTENEKEGAVREREDLRSTYEMLLRDHEKLAALHERQASEYEGLIGKHGGLKSAHKSLESQHRDLEDRYNQLLRQKDQLEELEKQLKAEQEKMLSENKSHEATAIDYYKLKEENERLNMAHRQLVKDNEGLQVDHKNLKSQMNSAKLEQTRLEADFSKLKEQYQQLDITSTKLTNQCELLSQLKGNLEEENRHLLDQIQTLMLQNRTLLEQTMESKDLFHVEQRQYIDKLNELRRQKEKLEEKIMDQYKFYDPSPPRRRGNWITLKMMKLIKPRSLERMRSLTLTPTRSESSEGFLGLPLDSQDSSSVGSGSNSLDDTLTQKRNSRKKDSQRVQHSHVQSNQGNQGSSNAVKWLPFMRNRSKEKDKAKDIYRRSMSMNDLLQSIALAGGQWAGSTENLEGPVEANGGSRSRHMKELGSMAYSTNAINYATLTLPSGNRAKRSLKMKDNASCEDVPASSDDPIGIRGQGSRASSLHSIKTISSNTSHSAPLEAKGTLNGNLSRPHSESSGEFSLSLDQEEWSSGSSPVQQPLSRSSHQSPMLLQRSLDPQATQAKKKNGSASGSANEVLSLQQFLEERIDPAESGSQENLTIESTRLSGGAEHVQRDRAERGSTGTKGRGILRSASGKAAPVNSDGRPSRGGQPGYPSLRKAESTRVKGMVQPRVSLSQSKAVSVSERLDISSSMLPRASSVISTAEGSTRRTSIHDLLSKDTRQPVSVDPSPSSKALPRAYTTPSEYPPTNNPTQSQHPTQQSIPLAPAPMPLSLPKSVSMPCTGSQHPLSCKETDLSSLESFFGSSFTVESVFMDSIFSEPAFTGCSSKSHTFLSLNTSLVSNISGPPGKTHLRPKPAQTAQNQPNELKPSSPDQNGEHVIDTNHVLDADPCPPLSPEDQQSLWYEYGCV